MVSVERERAAENDVGMGGGIRMAVWLCAVVFIVTALAIFGRASVATERVTDKVVAPAPMRLAAAQSIPAKLSPAEGIATSTYIALRDITLSVPIVPSETVAHVVRHESASVVRDDTASVARDEPATAANVPPMQTAVSGFRLASFRDTSLRDAVPRETPTHEPAIRIAPSRETTFGLASYYGSDSQTASGERFNPRAMTAAHRSLPFGTRVRVTNVSSGRSVTVRINDRGPFVRGRIIDLSTAAAESIGMVGRGVAKVKLDVVE